METSPRRTIAATSAGEIDCCDGGCACGPPTDAGPDAVAIACTLGPADRDRQLAGWNSVLAHVEERSAIDRGVRLGFGPDAPVTEIARLAVAEQDCCRFFAFALTVDRRGTALEVRAPDGGQGALVGLFGSGR